MDDVLNARNARNADELAIFVDLLRADLKADPEGYENVTLDDYLEALSAVFRDHQGVLLKGHEVGSVPYEILAHLLHTAAIYE